MKYMLMMNAPYGDGDYAIFDWSKEDLDRHVAFMKELNADLASAGEMVAGEGLTPPGQAKIVKAGDDHEPEITDGPFAESKEFLAGFWIVDVESAERAYAIAARVSTAPGPGGEPLHMAVEVRQVMGAPPA